MAFPPIQVLIPTWNNARDIDATVQSILQQEYDLEKIFLTFVDFGSIDGTLDKLYSLPQKNTGIFALQGIPCGRTMLAHAVQMLGLQNAPGRLLNLWPGDVLYPHCFNIAETWLKRLWKEQLPVTTLVTEVDIQRPDGNVVHQNPLFTGAGLLRAFSSDSTEYVRHGYRHQILLYGYCPSVSADKVGTYHNHIIHWNQLAHAGLGNNLAYIPGPLACRKEFEPADEMDDLLFRFETALTCFRMGQEQAASHMLGQGYEENFRHILAKYALWRAWQACRNGQATTAEDCFLMARIIDARMAQHEAWKHMEMYLNKGSGEDAAWLENWLNKEEPALPPKWPMGGMTKRLQRMWKQWRTKDYTSAWGQ